ncbi:MAG: DUF362 domain-containing protein [Atopobiaceae bacterium]|nr:DUF362 domain-containing protein [Atopobiaceae bacterium]
MHTSHMTRRTFLKVSGLTAGAFALGGLAACAQQGGSQQPLSTLADGREIPFDPEAAVVGEIAPANHTNHAGGGSTVYFTHDITPDMLTAIYVAVGKELTGKNIAVKLSVGEPGSNHLSTDLIAGLVSAVHGTIVECNTAYDGPRDNAESHYAVAADHGYSKIANFQIMDENGSLGLPVSGGFHLTENLVGAHFPEYDGMVMLSHFKGHQMAGFGGALKNMSIGLASAAGKFRIHSAGAVDSGWPDTDTALFQEAMADACKSVVDVLGDQIVYINVMNRLSVDCDCTGTPTEPKMADIGILASLDPVAVDQACVDLVYEADDDSIDLISRIETLNGEHVLEASESLGIGNRSYELVELH